MVVTFGELAEHLCQKFPYLVTEEGASVAMDDMTHEGMLFQTGNQVK